MNICYNKLLNMLNEMGVTGTTFKKNHVISQRTYTSIKSGQDITTKSISALCAFLNCQPGDILEYIPDETDGNTLKN